MVFKFIKKEKGFVAFFVTILILITMFGIALSLTVIVLGWQRISANIIKSTQAYYGAEAGIEDALLRLKQNPSDLAFSYTMSVGQGTVDVDVSAIIGGSRTITGQGDFSNRQRNLRIVYTIDATEISFYYGAQVGNGGVIMGNNARIKGNLFSNGNVVALGGKGYIDNSVAVAYNGNRIEGLEVGEDALAHTCKDSTIFGDLTYISGGSVVNCTAGGVIKSRPNEVEAKSLPIPQEQIDEWKQEAQRGGIINFDVFYNGSSDSLGPIQIGTTASPRNLIINNNSHITVTGTIYVTGDIVFNNNSIIELDQNSYGSVGGVIIADGNIIIDNGAVLRGSGDAGSYILVLSTSNSLEESDPAIFVGNNAEGAIFYTTSGLIYLKNNMKAREITGYQVQIENNAEIEYESGLENALFTSGPGGSWRVGDWEEIE